MTTKQDINDHKLNGSWRKLERLASDMADDASLRAGSKLEPKLGGGTRLMLELEHRISHDIDLFIRDPQWIGYLSPRLNDSNNVHSAMTSYSETSGSLKLNFPTGEIDFIVSMSLLGLPDEVSDETTFVLEPVAEVLAKKLFYRGWSLTPRDLFDWWAIETRRPELVPKNEMGVLIASKIDVIEASLDRLFTSDFSKQAWLAIQAPDKPSIEDVAQWGKSELQSYRSLIDILPSLREGDSYS